MRRLFAVGLVITGGTILLDWRFHFLGPHQGLPTTLATMKPNTALSFLAAGISLLLLPDGKTPSDYRLWRSFSAAALAAIVLSVGVLTLAEYASRVSFGIDELLFADPDTSPEKSPGRMALATALGFSFGGASLLFLARAVGRKSTDAKSVKIAHALAVVSAALGYIGGLGYLYSASTLFGFEAFATVAPMTTLNFMLLGASLFSTAPDLGWRSRFVQQPVARRAITYLISLAVLTPLLGGVLIVLGFKAGLIAADFVPILVVTATAVIGVALAFFAANILRNAEIKLAESQVTLHQSQEDFVRAQEVGQIGWWRLDVTQNILTWSPMNYRIFGVPEGAPLTYESFLAIVLPEDRDFVHAQWTAALAGKSYDIEHRIAVRGDIKWIREKAYLEFDEKGRLRGGFGISQDITDRKNAELALKESDRHKDEFLATLAHELRNPLAPIRNVLFILQESAIDVAKIKTVLPMMERQVDHLIRLVDDLLEISRISQGKLELKKGNCDLNSLLGDAVQASKPYIEADGHHLTVELPPTTVFLECDSTRLVQVFVNLLHNAAKFTPSGGRIELHAETRHDEAIISVRDNGIGIAKEAMPRIFDLFAQASQVSGRQQRGLGVGLSLARTLVEMHGGSIEARSDGPGKGSEFVVRLPLRHSIAKEPKIEKATRALPAATHRVLVVDDEPDVGDSLAMLLETLGMDVHVARSGQAALEAIRALKPRLAFLDIGMPEIDGLETARRIRALPEGRGLILYALSGWGREEDRKRAIEAGFNGHFVKPISLAELEDIIRTV